MEPFSLITPFTSVSDAVGAAEFSTSHQHYLSRHSSWGRQPRWVMDLPVATLAPLHSVSTELPKYLVLCFCYQGAGFHKSKNSVWHGARTPKKWKETTCLPVSCQTRFLDGNLFEFFLYLMPSRANSRHSQYI